ncbi:glycosyl hydrolase family 71-domain-containing protein, partial [Stachybotrys elegans]
MRIPVLLGICLSLLACYAEAKAVFAHFMVGNTASYNRALWETEMDLAKASRIDAFVLNIARGESMNAAQIENAFLAAASKGFKLLFSFDYAGRGPWPASEVLALLKRYGSTEAYWKHNQLPLVSTFEGPGNRDDWVGIKREFKCFFVPDWSSLGAEEAVRRGSGVIDGLFNWAAWPNHNDWPMDTYIDASYQRALGSMPYMMPVSPWFYTNLPKYDKNWLWRGEMLWFDRWLQTLHVQPEWVQIISWNDYGESHYIGPIRGDASLVALRDGEAPFNYVKGIEHGAWRAFLPYVIELYKTGTATLTKEAIMVWHRMQSKAAGCRDGNTTSFTATHMQPEGRWDVGMRDGIFFAAQLGSAGTAEVTVGGTVFKPEWRRSPYGGVGIYIGYVLTSNTGSVKVDIRRNGALVVSVTSLKTIGDCQEGYYNFNPTINVASGPTIAAKSPPINIKDAFCLQGTAVGEFADICANLCGKYDYCPMSACMCVRWGPTQTKGLVRGPPGYPAPGRDTNWSGLCAVACSYGYCPSSYCSMTKSPDIISSVSPFTPPSCTGGRANTALTVDQKALATICEFGCRHGYCPSQSCVCTSTGRLNLANPSDYMGGQPGLQHQVLHVRLLCRFTCGYG